jgi:hypothetical protein
MSTAIKDNKKIQTVLQTVLICVWGALSLLLAVLLILEGVSMMRRDKVVIKDPVDVHSSVITVINEEYKIYSVQTSGRLHNPTNNAVRVENLKVVLDADGREKVISFDSFLLPAYSDHEIKHAFESERNYMVVKWVEATVDGEAVVIPNLAVRSASAASGTVMAVYAMLLTGFVWLLIIAAKKRYYLYQESQMQRSSS